MKVQELITILEKLNDPNAIIDIASDEERNSFGDISKLLAVGKLKKTRRTVYSLYPINSQLPEERYN